MNFQKLEFSRRAKRREKDDEAGVMDEFAKLDFSTRGKRRERG